MLNINDLRLTDDEIHVFWSTPDRKYEYDMDGVVKAQLAKALWGLADWLKADIQNPDIDLEAGAYNIPAGFIGQPSDVGELAVFLASDAARYIVSQTVVIDGGQMSLMPHAGHFREPRTAHHGRGYVVGV